MKKKYLLSALLCIYFVIGSAQDSDIFEKWFKATLHLECRTTEPTVLHEKDRLIEQMNKDSISETDFWRSWRSIDDRRLGSVHTGTAIFVTYRGEEFLVTNKHVLFSDSMLSYYNNQSQYMRDFYYEVKDTVVDKMMVIPTFEEFDKHHTSATYLGDVNFSVGEKPYLKGYTWSDDETDLAVISISKDRPMSDSFLEDILSRGYKPIEVEKEISEPILSAVVYAIGFPARISIQRNIQYIDTISSKYMRSEYIGNHNMARGKIEMIDTLRGTIIGSIPSFPGNSGGPVIDTNGKLIGVVSRGLVLQRREKEYQHFILSVPETTIIDIRKVIPLLEKQYNKDRTLAERMKNRP